MMCLVLIVLVPQRRTKKWILLLGSGLTELAGDLVLVVAALDRGRRFFVAEPILACQYRVIRFRTVFGAL